MSLLTYADARPWARSIATKVSSREMPPWYVERNIGVQKFIGDPSLTDAEIATIVRSTIDLGHNLNLKVVAEGVEDLAAWKMLRVLGCDDAQGFFMSKPLAPRAKCSRGRTRWPDG